MRTSLRHLISNAAMITFVMAAFVACVKEEPEENSGLGAGDGVPVFSVTLNDGSIFSDRTIRGKVGVIEFSIPHAAIAGRVCRCFRSCMKAERRRME